MSNELAPDSRQSVDLKWKLRKALEKNVAPSDDGKGLDFGQDITVDGKLHLNELADIVGPDGNALFTDATQPNWSDFTTLFWDNIGRRRYQGMKLQEYQEEGASAIFDPLSPYYTDVSHYLQEAGMYNHLLTTLLDSDITLPDFGSVAAVGFLTYFKNKAVLLGDMTITIGADFAYGAECESIGVAPGKTVKVFGQFAYAFSHCTALKTIGAIDLSGCTNLVQAFRLCTSLTSILCTNIPVSFDVSATALEHDALVTLIGNLATVTTAQTLTMGEAKLALLSDEEKLGATNKGWTLA